MEKVTSAKGYTPLSDFDSINRVTVPTEKSMLFYVSPKDDGYSLDLKKLNYMQQAIFLDAIEKVIVMKINFENDTVTITALTAKPIHIHGEICANDIKIKSVGELYFYNTLKGNNLHLNAKRAIFYANVRVNSIENSGGICVYTLEDAIRAQKVNIDSTQPSFGDNRYRLHASSSGSLINDAVVSVNDEKMSISGLSKQMK